jgi:hypothetical protein
LAQKNLQILLDNRQQLQPTDLCYLDAKVVIFPKQQAALDTPGSDAALQRSLLASWALATNVSTGVLPSDSDRSALKMMPRTLGLSCRSRGQDDGRRARALPSPALVRLTSTRSAGPVLNGIDVVDMTPARALIKDIEEAGWEVEGRIAGTCRRRRRQGTITTRQDGESWPLWLDCSHGGKPSRGGRPLWWRCRRRPLAPLLWYMPVGLDCAQDGALAIHGLAALTEPNPGSVNLLGTGDSRAEKTWIPLSAFRGPLLLNMRMNAVACLRLPGPALYPAEHRSTSGVSAEALYAVARELDLGVMAADSVSTLLYIAVCAVQAETTGPMAARLVTCRLPNVVTELLQTVFLADRKVHESDVTAARAILVVLLAQRGKNVVTIATSSLRCALLTRIMELVGLKSAHYLVIGSVLGGCRERPYWRAGRGLCRLNVRRISDRICASCPGREWCKQAPPIRCRQCANALLCFRAQATAE